MANPLLKRRLNPFLLASTVLILSLLAGLSVLYQGQLENVVSDKQDLKNRIDQKNARISQLQEKNANLSATLRDRENDLGRYVDLYRSEKKQKKELREDVSNLTEEVNELETRVSDLQDQVDTLNTSLGLACLDENNLTETAETECGKRGHG